MGSWFAVDVNILDNAKIRGLPHDFARLGFIYALAEAKLLRQRGAFTPRQWRARMGQYERQLWRYRAAGLIHVMPDDCPCLDDRGSLRGRTIVIHDWDIYQREPSRARPGLETLITDDDPGFDLPRARADVARRDARADVAPASPAQVRADVARAHARGLETTVGDVTPRAGARALSHAEGRTTNRESVPTRDSENDQRFRESFSAPERALVDLVEELTGHRWLWGQGPLDLLREDVANVPLAEVEAAYRAAAAQARSRGRRIDGAGVVVGGHKWLYPMPAGPAIERPSNGRKGKGMSDVSLAEVWSAVGRKPDGTRLDGRTEDEEWERRS